MVSNINSNPPSLLGPMSLATQEDFLKCQPTGSSPTDAWHSVLFPRQAQKLLDGWAGPGFTSSQHPPPRPETRKHGD